MKYRSPTYLGLALGVIYGLLIRSFFEVLEPFGLGLVSISFFFFVPFVIGYIRVHFEYETKDDLTVWKSIRISWQPIFAFLLTTFVTFLEGSICIIMALPIFMLFSGLGGVLARYNQVLIKRKSVLFSVALIPLALTPIESLLPAQSSVYTVQNSIVINASAEQIWHQIGVVSEIDEEELSFGITRFIGVPRPLKADMSGSGVGAIRTSTWDKGIVFQEIITAWEPNLLMGYNFIIDPALIPDTSLDKHVKMGGEYFSPLEGEYHLSLNEDGTTTLSLSTTMRDNTKFGMYSRLWGEIIFSDFHSSLLKLIKQRSE